MKAILKAVLVAIALLTSRIVHAQGTTTFLSNLGQTSSGAISVGSDSWFAAQFYSGNNPGGYLLNSIQLAMTDASGVSSGFNVTIYSGIDIHGGVFPGTSLGTLTGSADPSTAGLYTFSAAADLALSSSQDYFIVVTAGTTVANGAYEWSVTGTPSPGFTSFHWGGETLFAESSDGLNWNYTSANYGQFALDATPAPEPGVIGLFALGGLLVGFRRWKANRSNEKNNH